ncbi:MAG: SDR family oxidoreductase [Acidobacteria bacterium]|nr:SDR family oxidoreductase [Acidobacteriota bacterium]
MLGHKVTQVLSTEIEVYASFRGAVDKFAALPFFKNARLIPDIDVFEPAGLFEALAEIRPDVVVNAIGIVKQVPDSKNDEKTIYINALLPHKIAAFTAPRGIRLINISTDCVFSGRQGSYVETDFPDAGDLYGKSKHLGEVRGENCLTIRTSIIGRELFTRHSLIEWFLSNRGGRVVGFKKAYFSGFTTIEMADILKLLILDFPKLEGLYHISAEKISKYDLLGLVNAAFQTDVEITPSEEFAIDRSLNSDKFRALTGYVPPSWESMIETLAADGKDYRG